VTTARQDGAVFILDLGFLRFWIWDFRFRIFPILDIGFEILDLKEHKNEKRIVHRETLNSHP
jgi:hypothetical protein